MTVAAATLRERLSERFSRLGDAVVFRIEDQRTGADLPRVLIGLSDALPSLTSELDDSVTALSQREEWSSPTRLDAKRLALEMVDAKSRSLQRHKSRGSSKQSIIGRRKAIPIGVAVGGRPSSTDLARFDLDLKQAISSALR